jgi:hypothetical protein
MYTWYVVTITGGTTRRYCARANTAANAVFSALRRDQSKKMHNSWRGEIRYARITKPTQWSEARFVKTVERRLNWRILIDGAIFENLKKSRNPRCVSAHVE